ncbi:unnamed protein product [Ilex paraguariensis]|uniref:Uncharacterized protein n=1 Tax=Ilex paraguariensis TaxID=185542 RepID=A0ABC8SQK1_9AQUA
MVGPKCLIHYPKFVERSFCDHSLRIVTIFQQRQEEIMINSQRIFSYMWTPSRLQAFNTEAASIHSKTNVSKPVGGDDDVNSPMVYALDLLVLVDPIMRFQDPLMVVNLPLRAFNSESSAMSLAPPPSKNLAPLTSLAVVDPPSLKDLELDVNSAH